MRDGKIVEKCLCAAILWSQPLGGSIGTKKEKSVPICAVWTIRGNFLQASAGHWSVGVHNKMICNKIT